MDGVEEAEGFATARRRLAAFAADVVLVVMGLALLVKVAPDFCRGLGPWGRALGALVVVVYTGLGNSRLFRGQTVGKRAFGLQVVGRNGEPLALSRSLGRSAVLWLPLALNGATVPGGPTALAVALFVVMAVVPLLSVYLLFRNVPTRRCVHDLAGGSAVVDQGEQHRFAARLPKRHAVVVAVVTGVFVVLGGALVVGASLAPAGNLRTLLGELEAVPGLWSVSASERSTTTFRSGEGSETTHGLTVEARAYGTSEDFPALSRAIARVTLRHFPETTEKDYLSVELDFGPDLFLYSSSDTRVATAPPAEWMAALSGGK